MDAVSKILYGIAVALLVTLITFLSFLIYDVSTTTCLENDTVKRIVSVNGNANRAVIELTNGGTITVVLGHTNITEGKTVCKNYGKR